MTPNIKPLDFSHLVRKHLLPNCPTSTAKLLGKVWLVGQLGSRCFTAWHRGVGFCPVQLLKNLTTSGVRVRSIEYNYSPVNDKIGDLHAPGYNACELSFTAVGSYSQLQSFFKNLTKNKNLSSIYEIYIEPYDKDKTILIAKFKIRLYTKTMA